MSDLAFIGKKQASQDEVYYEYRRGIAYAMATPSGPHQIIQHELAQQLKQYFKDKKCQAFTAPFGVDLTEYVSPQGDKERTVYIPDISVVWDPSKYDARTGTYYGPPALVAEIGSPSTLDKDLREKLDDYELSGVPNYLVVMDQYTVNYYQLQNGRYEKTQYIADKNRNVSISIVSFPDLTLEIRDDWFWFGR